MGRFIMGWMMRGGSLAGRQLIHHGWTEGECSWESSSFGLHVVDGCLGLIEASVLLCYKATVMYDNGDV